MVGLGIPFTLFNIVGSLFQSPIAFGLGLVFGALYFLITVPLMSKTPLWPDFKTGKYGLNGARLRRQGSTTSWLLASIFWGAIAALTMVMIPEVALMDIAQKMDWESGSLSLAGGYAEEIAKTLGVILLVLAYRQINRPWHAVMTGFFVGLGFEVMENVLYGSTFAMLDPNSDLDGTLLSWTIRTFAAPLLHAVLSAIAAYGVGLAFFRRNRSVPWRAMTATLWVLLAFALHFIWNWQWDSEMASYANIIVVWLIMYPTFIFIFVRCWKQAKQDHSYGFTPFAITQLGQLKLLTDANKTGGKHKATKASGSTKLRDSSPERNISVTSG